MIEPGMTVERLAAYPAASQVATLALFRFARLPARLWAFGMMYFARAALRRVPGIGFWKLLGAGTGEGFTPLPNTAVCGILATWPDAAAARAAQEAAIFRRYRAMASEALILYLAPLSARGAWDGQAPFTPAAADPCAGPLAALTRATLRTPVLLRFWARVPAIERLIGANRDVLFKIGLGEVPWLQQVTFSIWPDGASMARFARNGTLHDQAIRAVREGGWFREELYARFRLLGHDGTWGGRDPLARS
jgi:spheroidene monooxygenase